MVGILMTRINGSVAAIVDDAEKSAKLLRFLAAHNRPNLAWMAQGDTERLEWDRAAETAIAGY